MKMPFSTEEFLNVFGRYNSDVWPIQFAFYIFAMILLFVLFANHSKKDTIINLMLSFFWLWMGIVYHIMYFSGINPIAIAFGAVFIIQAFIFGYFGILRSQLKYRRDKTFSSLMGTILVIYGLVIYPILSFSFGHIYPKMPTFGLPCPTTIFTFGILLFSVYRLSWYIYLIPLLWSVIGFSAAMELSITEDFALGITAVIALAAFAAKTQRRTQTPLAKG
jgi:hypothetical protein